MRLTALFLSLFWSLALQAEIDLGCHEAKTFHKFLLYNQSTLLQLEEKKTLLPEQLKNLEKYYVEHFRLEDRLILLENLGHNPSPLIVFTEEQRRAFYLLKEEKEQRPSIEKIISMLHTHPLWSHSVTETINSLSNKLLECSTPCEARPDQETQLHELFESQRKVLDQLSRDLLVNEIRHYDVESLPDSRGLETFPNQTSAPAGTIAFNDLEKRQELFNSKNNLETIRLFHQAEREFPFVVIDKNKQRLFVFGEKGLLFSRSLSIDENDEFDKGGAGIYKLIKFDDDMVYLKDQRERRIHLKLENEWVYCEEAQACSQGAGNPPSEIITLFSKKQIPYYILPGNPSLKFVVKNSQLTFTTFQKLPSYFQFNFSPRNIQAQKITSRITIKEFDTEVARTFMQTLDNEKEKLMRLYNLDNDDYNRLARLAFGILGQESRFGTHWRYHLKEGIPSGVAYLKQYKGIFKSSYQKAMSEGFKEGFKEFVLKRLVLDGQLLMGHINTSQNSRGPTQIKKVPEKIAQNYGVTKETLDRPEHAAVATLGFLAEALVELKAKEKFHPDINGTNRHHYLHYIFMGRSQEIVKGTATPELNIYYQNLQKFMLGVEIYQEI